ncbi:hypothetical protein ACWKSP_09285 [Micromonosporaceae bacterium Da 78-11]
MPRSLSALVLIALTAVLVGCSDDGVAPAPPADPAASTWTVTGSAEPDTSASGVVDDPPGTITCALLAAAIERSSLMEPGVTDDINRASGTADAPVADAAKRLTEAYAAAVAAVGATDEPDKTAAVSAAAADMAGVCADSGLETVG